MQLKPFEQNGVLYGYFSDSTKIPRLYSMASYFDVSEGNARIEALWTERFGQLNTFLATLTVDESKTLLEAYDRLSTTVRNKDDLSDAVQTFLTSTQIIIRLSHFVLTSDHLGPEMSKLVMELRRLYEWHRDRGNRFAALFNLESYQLTVVTALLFKLLAPLFGDDVIYVRRKAALGHSVSDVVSVCESVVGTLLKINTPPVMSALYDYAKSITERSHYKVDADDVDSAYHSDAVVSDVFHIVFTKAMAGGFVVMDLNTHNSSIFTYFELVLHHQMRRVLSTL